MIRPKFPDGIVVNADHNPTMRGSWFWPIVITMLLLSPFAFVRAETINQPFTYTATGDDGMVGQASRAVIRMARAADSLLFQWEECVIILDTIPWAPGVTEQVVAAIDVETGVTYYFAIWIADEVPNWSDISNIVSKVYADQSRPDAVTDLQLGAPE